MTHERTDIMTHVDTQYTCGRWWMPCSTFHISRDLPFVISLHSAPASSADVHRLLRGLCPVPFNKPRLTFGQRRTELYNRQIMVMKGRGWWFMADISSRTRDLNLRGYYGKMEAARSAETSIISRRQDVTSQKTWNFTFYHRQWNPVF